MPTSANIDLSTFLGTLKAVLRGDFSAGARRLDRRPRKVAEPSTSWSSSTSGSPRSSSGFVSPSASTAASPNARRSDGERRVGRLGANVNSLVANLAQPTSEGRARDRRRRQGRLSQSMALEIDDHPSRRNLTDGPKRST